MSEFLAVINKTEDVPHRRPGNHDQPPEQHNQPKRILSSIVALVTFGLTAASQSASINPAPPEPSNDQAGISESPQDNSSRDKRAGVERPFVIVGTCRDWDKVLRGAADQTIANVTVTLVSARGLRQTLEVLATTKADAKAHFNSARLSRQTIVGWTS